MNKKQLSWFIAWLLVAVNVIFFLSSFAINGDPGISVAIYTGLFLLFGQPVGAALLSILPSHPKLQFKNSLIVFVSAVALSFYYARHGGGYLFVLPTLFYLIPIIIGLIRKRELKKFDPPLQDKGKI